MMPKLFIAASAFVLLACTSPELDKDPGPGTSSDSQTHWLKSCDSNADCGSLVCTCERCQKECASDLSCGEVSPYARCAEATSEAILSMCGEAPPTSLCVPGERTTAGPDAEPLDSGSGGAGSTGATGAGASTGGGGTTDAAMTTDGATTAGGSEAGASSNTGNDGPTSSSSGGASSTTGAGGASGTCDGDLRVVEGSVTAVTEAELEALRDVREITGSLTIGSLTHDDGWIPVPVASLAALSCLSRVNALTISNAVGLKNLADLDSLELLDGLSLNDNPDLESLEGLEALTSLGSLLVARNQALTSLEGLHFV
ncbi:MAG TPA: hypothetical protein VI197_12645, partial [Polyangiaceae bacterium]